jgi:fucose 4-O-acetylase-like acetyltransferase
MNLNPSKERNPLYDNWKFFLIFSVVLVHMFSPGRSEGIGLTQNVFCNSFCTLIHLYVMPSFFFISGYFSSVEITNTSTRSILSQLLLPYAFFELIFIAIFPKHFLPNYYFIQPFYHLWFLGLLFLYRITAPWLNHANLIGLAILCLLVSFLSHLEIDSMVWCSWNFFKYWPYFLIGLWVKRKKIDISSYNCSKKWKFFLTSLVMLIFYLFFVFEIDSSEVIADGSSSRRLTGLPLMIHKYSHLESFIRDLIVRSLSVVISAYVFFIIPREKIWISKYGSNTLYTYLLHPIIIHLFAQSLHFYHHHGSIFLLILFILSFLITVILSMNFVSQFGKIFFNYVSEKISNSH